MFQAKSRPNRCDAGINLLSLGHAGNTKRRILQDYVRPGMKVLDIGCGAARSLWTMKGKYRCPIPEARSMN